MKTIRIFISSPGDVAEERDRARQVVEQLRHRYAGQFDLKALLWEDLPLQAVEPFQQGIDWELSKERGIDIAIFILWSRLGSPLGALIPKSDGSPYRSGTEREFDLVLAARRQSGTDSPKILVYTRQDEASFDERLRGKPIEEKVGLLEQKRLVESFIKEEFHDAGTKTNIRAYHTFDYPVTFSHRLRVHLQEILDPLADNFAGDPVWDIAKKGSPFRGLEAFEFDHNAVFFGREDEILEVRRALQRKAREGCAFVLISGASGSGKSSLARAGVLPAIVQYEVDQAVSSWRRAVCTPSQLGVNLCMGLARLLCSENVLPELRTSDESCAILGEGFARAPKQTVDQSVRPALARATQGKPGAVRLCLLVDQVEEIFTDKRLSDDDRDRFATALECLARTGVVWVLATVRSDFYQHCQRLPALMRMKEGPGQVDLLPPTPDALQRLIAQPSLLARLSFEKRDGASLAGHILNDAAAHTELLPLLSYLLRELFEQRTDQGTLTFAAYEQLGGVEGALAKRAETVFSSLPDAAQHELGNVLRALVSVSGDEEESIVRQRISLDTFPPKTPARTLVDRFIQERLFVTDADADRKATVAVAHEALLRAWKRIGQWVADNLEFLRVRARVAARMKEGKGSRLLEGDLLLEQARQHLATNPAGFSGEQTAFITDSVSAMQRSRRRREWIRNGVVAILAMSTLVAMLASVRARHQGRVAETAAAKSQEETRFLTNMLFTIEPDVARGSDTTLMQAVLTNAAGSVTKDLANQPEVEIEMMGVLAQVYHELGLYEPMGKIATNALQIAEGQPKPDLKTKVHLLHLLGLSLMHLNEFGPAENTMRDELKLQEQLHGTQSSEFAGCLNNLGDVLCGESNYPNAERVFRRALAIRTNLFGLTNLDVGESFEVLAVSLRDQDKLAEAEPNARASLKIQQMLLPKSSLKLADPLRILASVLWRCGKLAEAETNASEALALDKKYLANTRRRDIDESYGVFINILYDSGKFDQACEESEAALKARRSSAGNTPGVASLYPIYLYREYVGKLKTKLNSSDKRVWVAEENLADAHIYGQQYKPAASIYTELLKSMKAATNSDPSEIAQLQASLSFVQNKLEGQNDQ